MSDRIEEDKTTETSAGAESGEKQPTEGGPTGTGGGGSYKPKYVPLWENVVTIGGIYLAVIALILMLTFGLFSVVSPASNPYVDIIGYLIIPTILGVGVVLMPLGILFKSWRLHRQDSSQRLTIRFPKIDLNDPQQRRVAKILGGGAFILLPILGVSGYHGYHFTDSVEFCARACHAVMEPESTSFDISSHARVACAACHIGSGASWFVKAKLSGIRQVLAVLRKNYSRPIPPAISQLRPARDTCEQCHWPNKFFGSQLRMRAHFSSDEDNSRNLIKMLIKTGGADESTGRKEGIHMHMLLNGVTEYIATDDKLQEIPWVRMVDPLGEELIYRSDGVPSSAPRPEGQLRQMDCMDCHNRPAHNFRSPDQAVDAFLEAGRIDTTLPFVKRQIVAALSLSYADRETAKLQIVNRIIEFYRRQYPDRYDSDTASVRQAADMAVQIHRENFFPYMRVDWPASPDNIGHLESPGCFRCHDGRHINQYGVPISHNCDICHTFFNTVSGADGQTLISEGQFIHPVELEGMHSRLRCDQCHSGGPAKDRSCEGCHGDEQGLYGGSLAVLAHFQVEPNPMFESVDCEGCHNLAEPVSLAAVDALCVDCHDDDDEYVGMLEGWAQSVSSAQAVAEAALKELDRRLAAQATVGEVEAREKLDEIREVLRTLVRANPLHNPDGAQQIFNQIADEARDLAASLNTRYARGGQFRGSSSDEVSSAGSRHVVAEIAEFAEGRSDEEVEGRSDEATTPRRDEATERRGDEAVEGPG